MRRKNRTKASTKRETAKSISRRLGIPLKEAKKVARQVRKFGGTPEDAWERRKIVDATIERVRTANLLKINQPIRVGQTIVAHTSRFQVVRQSGRKYLVQALSPYDKKMWKIYFGKDRIWSPIDK